MSDMPGSGKESVPDGSREGPEPSQPAGGLLAGARAPAAAQIGLRLDSYGLLLVLILAAFAIEGVVTPSGWQLVALTSLLGATLLLSLKLADVRAGVMWTAVAAVVGLVLAATVQAITGGVDDRATRVANGLLVAVAPPAIVIGVIRRLRAAQAVTIEAVVGVVCVYVLIGMFYAFLYGAIDHVGNVPFFTGAVAATMSHCLYFSFTTISTVGYGDLTASTNLGHTLAVSEALLGQVYLVTVVSLIVGNLGRRRAR